MLADIAAGHIDAADILLLVAVIVFAVGGVVAFQAKALWAALIGVGLALQALALLLL